MRRDLDLTTRIAIAAVALVLAAIAALAYVLDWHQRRTFLAERGAQLGDGIRAADRRLRQTIDILRRDVVYLARTPPVGGILRASFNHGFDSRDGNPLGVWRQRLEENYAAFAEAHPHYYRIRYVGVADGGRELSRVELTDGRATAAKARQLPADGDAEFFRATLRLQPGQIYLSDLHLGPGPAPVPTLQAATPVYAPDGAVFGLVLIDMDVSQLLAASREGLPGDVHAYLAAMTGDYLAHPDPAMAFGFDRGARHRWQDDMPALADSPAATAHAGLQAVLLGGEPAHVATGRVAFDPMRPERFWQLIYALPDSVAAEQTRTERRSLLAGSLLAALGAGALVVFALGRLFAPLRQVTVAAESIAEGGSAVALPAADGGEIGALVRAFRHMLERIRQREGELIEMNAALEARVQERTAELQLAASVFHNTAEGVTVTSAEGTILSVNPAFTEITGYTAAEAVGQRPNMLRSDRHGPEFYRDLWGALLREGRWQGEIWNRRKGGEAYLEWLTISMVPDGSGKPFRYVAVFHDITELRRKDEHIRHLAYHDALTGLPNRSLLLDRLEHAIARGRREVQRLGLMFVDLDRFKTINDSLGHDVGDKLLEETARRLAAAVRSSDTVARMGGDEFVVLAEQVGGPADCAALAEKILVALTAPVQVGPHNILVGASLGLAVFPEDGSTTVELMKNADAAMYAAKAAGRGTYRFFQPAMTELTARRLALEMELRQAIPNNELELHYQPKVCLRSGAAAGFEALVRWRHPRRGLVPPVDFIPVAEETGLIVAIGDWVLTEACRQAAEWQAKGHANVKIAINVSAKQLQQGDLAQRIEEVAAQYGIAPGTLEAEITESEVMANPAQAAAIFQRLRAIGVTVAVDDFGTGYSSLAYLRRLPIDVLKIDRSFVKDADRNEEDAQIVRTILALGKALRMSIVAEGVEMESQADLLRDADCPLAQGYLYSRPVPADEAEQWLAAMGRRQPDDRQR